MASINSVLTVREITERRSDLRGHYEVVDLYNVEEISIGTIISRNTVDVLKDGGKITIAIREKK